MKLHFYQINKEYLEFLRCFEKRVPYLKETRPFLGILLEVKKEKYFVPLSSPKQKHQYISNSQDLIKIRTGKLGVINLNNMIPVIDKQYSKINILKITDEKYKWLLDQQLEWCNAHQEEIQRKAKQVYQKRRNSTELQNRCCNFKRLEQKSIHYKNKLQDQDVYYQVS